MQHASIAGLLLAALAAVAHAAPASAPEPAAPASAQGPLATTPASRGHWATPVKPDANLHRVDHKLYRSEQLAADDVTQVEQLGIKSIVNLRFFDRNDNHSLFANHNIQLINRPLITWNVTPADIARVLHTIEQAQQHGPVLVHCYHGADRTGTIVGMYRIIYQDWTPEQARQEMQQGGFGYHSIWKNLEKLFTPENVQQVRQHLAALQASAKAPAHNSGAGNSAPAAKQ